MEWKIKELVNQSKTEIFKNDIQRDECVVEKNENQNIITATFQSKYCRKLKEVWKYLSARDDKIVKSIIEERSSRTINKNR